MAYIKKLFKVNKKEVDTVLLISLWVGRENIVLNVWNVYVHMLNVYNFV